MRPSRCRSSKLRPRAVVGRYSRAALLALGAAAAAAGTTIACDNEEVSTPLYGGPGVVVDAGPDPANDDSGATQAIYGAPANPDGGAR